MLKSKLYNQTYIGSTKDLREKEISTRRYRPWSLLYYEAYLSEKLARIREKRLKYNGNGLRELKKRIGLIKSGAGFTLIELLIVIAVIGILAGGIMFFLDPVAQIQKANDSKRKSDLSRIEKAIKIFYQDVGKYPDAVDNKIKGLDGNAVNWGNSWLPYISTLPADPNSSKNYVYFVSTDGQTYYIYANLDREINDGQICKSDGSQCDNAPALGCGKGYICNYGISSPNVSP